MAAAPIIAAVITAGMSAVQMNQAAQQRKGAENAAKDQQQQIQQQLDKQKAADLANLNQKGMEAGASQKSAIDAIRAAMSASSGAGGTILSGPQGAMAAPTTGKTLLGV